MRNFWILIVLSFNLIADGHDEHKKSKCYDEEEIDLPDNFTVRYVSPEGNDDVDNDCTDKHNPCKTIQKALDEAVSGDVIELLEGTFFEPEEVIIEAAKSPIFIFGQGEKESIVDGNNDHRLFFLADSDVTFCGLTLRNGNGEGFLNSNGGAIYNFDGELVIIHTTLSNNRTNANGGAIYNGGEIPLISHSTLCNNEAEQAGGAIYNGGTITTISNSTFSDNEADGNGGAIQNAGFIATINHSLFSENKGDFGGAIANSEGQTINNITNSTFKHNKARENGGAIRNVGIINAINNDIFSHNKAKQEGGAIANVSIALITTIAQSYFANNQALFGGAIRNSGLINNIIESTFTCNESFNDGGAIFNVGTTNITASTLNDNKAHDDGGAIFNQSGTTTIVNSTLSGNKAHDSGGGVLNNGGTTNIRNSTITENKASDAAVVRVAGNIIVYSTIIGDQRRETADCSGTITDDNFNLDSDGTCNWTEPNSFTADPKLEPLDNYGGPTETHRPSAASPSINASELGNCEVTTDQRGFPRPSPPGGRCDIGSVEIQQVL